MGDKADIIACLKDPGRFQYIEKEDVPEEQLHAIPEDQKEHIKHYVRFNDALLQNWFHLCKLVSRKVSCFAQADV